VEKAELLDNGNQVRETDPGRMLEAVAEQPRLLQNAWEISRNVNLPKIKKVRQVIVAGMGGSAVSGDLAVSLLASKLKTPLLVNRDYLLPAQIDKESLLVALSYSGNTEETLSAVQEAGRRGLKVICVTAGGRLKELAEAKGYPCYLIPAGYQPRAALPYLLVPLLTILSRLELAPVFEPDLKEAIALLQKLRDDYELIRPTRNNPAKQLAKKLQDKIPLIFGSVGLTAAAALRFKTQLNENSKVTAMCNLFPELNHNELVNLFALKRGKHNFTLVLLRDEGDSERLKKRMEITKSLIGNQLGGINELFSQGKSPLARLLSLVYLGDFVSAYLAIVNGVDPTPVEAISRLKKELAR
jgi:glucose/mannose-6-phosphate isomerase